MRGLDDDDNDVLGDLPPTLTFDNLDTLRSSRKQALGEAAKRRRKVVSEDGEAVDEEDARSRVVGGEDDNHNHLGGKEEEKKGDKKEEPKAKRVRREVAKLDADRLLSPSGLDALVGIAKNIKLKGKRHEFEDLQQIMFQYQKWGHQVFPKVVFRSFLETTEKICRERRVKVWRDTLIRKERRHAMGLLSDDEEIGVEKMETDVQLIDAAAPQNGRSIDEALDLMDSLDAAEEDELLRLAAALDPLPVAAKAALQAPSPPARLSVMQDDEEDFDFEAEMMLQLSELPVRPSIREELGNLEPERKSVKAVMSSLTSIPASFAEEDYFKIAFRGGVAPAAELTDEIAAPQTATPAGSKSVFVDDEFDNDWFTTPIKPSQSSSPPYPLQPSQSTQSTQPLDPEPTLLEVPNLKDDTADALDNTIACEMRVDQPHEISLESADVAPTESAYMKESFPPKSRTDVTFRDISESEIPDALVLDVESIKSTKALKGFDVGVSGSAADEESKAGFVFIEQIPAQVTPVEDGCPTMEEMEMAAAEDWGLE